MNTRKKTNVYQYTLTGVLVKVHESVAVAATAAGLSVSNVRNATKNSTRAGDFLWRTNELKIIEAATSIEQLQSELVSLKIMTLDYRIYDGKAYHRNLFQLRSLLSTLLPDFNVDVHTGSELVYRIKMDLRTRPACSICSATVAFNNATVGYSTTCGFLCSAQEPTRIAKRTTTWRNNYKFGHPSSENRCEYAYSSANDPDWLIYQHHTLKKSILCIANELNMSDTVLGKYFKKYNIAVLSFQQSTGERQIADFIKELGHDTHCGNKSIIPPYELDIFVPSNKVAIEYCGLYWHSERFKSPQYHLNKHKRCADVGVRLITIFEDEWTNKPEIVKSKLRSIVEKTNEKVVYARRCHIRPISNKEKKQFLDLYHIQGDGPGSIWNGLFFGEDLVAVMGFIQQATQHTLNRYATKYHVVGGFTKLLKHFQRNYNWEKIVSFADLRWSSGKLYDVCGFALVQTLPPDYNYIVGAKREHKFKFRHIHLKNKLKNYDPELSEVANCHNHGMYRIWNCGLLKYELVNPSLSN